MDDIEVAVEELTARGVTFERGERVDEKGILRDTGFRIAWFKDPARNILPVLQTG